MLQPLKKITLCLLLSAFTASSAANTLNYNDLPSIGTAAASTLSIEKEIEYGDVYMRTMRASQPIVNDPVLTNYISTLGATLITNAQDVKTPFHFFLVQRRDINAFAFFGGNIGLHTGLFLYAATQSELASVMAHEIAHLTQRHLARSMEDQSKKTPLTMAAMLGSVLLAIAAPQAGIAAIQATGAATMQSRINYTRSNEQEADRIGLDILSRAGFDVNGMPSFFTRMADQYRFSSKPPQMLLTHPLPDSRITESRSRAQQYGKKNVPVSLQYHLARARVVARFLGYDSSVSLNWFARQLKTANPDIAKTLRYGQALVYLDNNKFEQAEKILTPLLKSEPNNLFYLDAVTDLNINQKQYSQALNRLNKALAIQPDNRVLLLNRDYTLVRAGEFKKARAGLQRYTYHYPSDPNGWSLLQQVNEKLGHRHASLAAQAELFALQAKWANAISNYTQASAQVKVGSLDQARYDARIDQLRVEQARFNAIANS